MGTDANDCFVWFMMFKAMHFQQYFSYIVAVSYIGGGNQRILRKPPTCCKSLTTLSHVVTMIIFIKKILGSAFHSFFVIF